MPDLLALRVNVASMRSAGIPFVQLQYDQIEKLIELADIGRRCSTEHPQQIEPQA